MNALLTKLFLLGVFFMTKIQSINSNQLYIARNAEVSLKLAGNTAQVTFTAGKNRKCPIKNAKIFSEKNNRPGRRLKIFENLGQPSIGSTFLIFIIFYYRYMSIMKNLKITINHFAFF